MSTKRRFELVEGQSSKFWEVWIDGTSVVTRYGKIGASGQTTMKEAASPEKASTLYEKLVREKTGKGYIEKGGGPAATPSDITPQTGYRARFLAMVKQLKKNKLVTITTFEIAEPASVALIAEAAEAAGGSLPPGVAELYAELNGFKLEWTLADDADTEDFEGEDAIEGSINIRPIYGPNASADAGVFSDYADHLYFSEDDPKRQIKPFDFFVPEACAVFFPVPGKATIHYHCCGEELHPTGYSLNEYLDLLLVSRGYRYWIEALCVDKRESSACEEFLHNAPLLFKDCKPTLFKPKTTKGEIAID